MAIKSYRDLIVWQKAMDLVEEVYKKTKGFPREELYGLTSQLRRAVVSVPSNIAEGQGRSSTKEFLHHLSIAYGSLCEVGTQILIAHRLGFLETGDVEVLDGSCSEVGRLINGLSNRLPKDGRRTDH
ncbi:MAG TPA: four helix bundle protein [Blastocatellia bacterium]|nr:four helix bundle protein [Blastocatellia bacterium]